MTKKSETEAESRQFGEGGNMKSTALVDSGVARGDENPTLDRERMMGLDALAMRDADRTEKELILDVHLARSLSPLNSLTESHLAELLRNSKIEVVFRGQALFESGSYDGQHLYLLHGDIELLDNHSEVTLVRAGNSALPISHHQPRTCRAMAKTDCSVLRIDSEYLDKMLAWSQVAEYLLLDISYHRDLDEDAEWMMTILKSNLFFKVPPTNAHVIFERLKTMMVGAGEAVLRQGEIGDNCYFIKQGKAEVRQSPDGITPPVKIAEIGEGRCFGEDALVNETVRNASVIMQTDGVLMYISKRDFLKLLREPKVNTADTKEVQELIDQGAVCIDVRTVEEYEQGHLEKAINIPLNLLRIKTRLLDKDTQYVIYCDTGRRSRAATHLLKKGKLNAVALLGGLKNSYKNLQLQTDNHDFVLKDGNVIQGE